MAQVRRLIGACPRDVMGRCTASWPIASGTLWLRGADTSDPGMAIPSNHAEAPRAAMPGAITRTISLRHIPCPPQYHTDNNDGRGQVITPARYLSMVASRRSARLHLVTVSSVRFK